MTIVRTYALAMELPEGKRAGYYAQIVKALAQKAPVFDRDKELLIFAELEQRQAAEPIMEQYAVPAELLDLLLLPEAARLRPSFSDYGFTSLLQRHYVYADTVSAFRLRALTDATDTSPAATSRPPDPVSAAAQLEEHVLADWLEANGERCFAIERQHDVLAARIAMAYGCTVDWLVEPYE
ncbi:hypothetical protein [Paenibacillus sp. YYML68]|uniref:hypothetical protein n=1 Tax=Paenibacillus sp. YYML68 TaxID=2909250 RepID=UPI0024908E09|nr:hypothetical protein [Paenibacillus sp. YYML68]